MSAVAKTEKYSYMGCRIRICKLCWRRKKKKNTKQSEGRFVSWLLCFVLHTHDSLHFGPEAVNSESRTSLMHLWATCDVSFTLCWTVIHGQSQITPLYAYFDKTQEKRPSVISQTCGWHKCNTDVKNWNLPLSLVYSYIKTQCCCSSSAKSSIRKSTWAQRKQGHRWISPLFESRGRVAESRWKQMSWFECAAPPAI